MAMTTYRVETLRDGQWTSDGIGDSTGYESEAAAERASVGAVVSAIGHAAPGREEGDAMGQQIVVGDWVVVGKTREDRDVGQILSLDGYMCPMTTSRCTRAGSRRRPDGCRRCGREPERGGNETVSNDEFAEALAELRSGRLPDSSAKRPPRRHRPRPAAIIIAYQIEQADEGWLVWRRVGERAPEVMGPIIASRPGAHSSRESAQQTIEMQRRADRAAATRLGVEVEHL